MDLREAVLIALEGKAILFAGSGFSFGAKNYKQEDFPCGNGLRDRLAKACGLDKTDSSLSAVADYYLSINGHSQDSLIEFIKSTFTLGTITDAQEEIMSIRWKRVYTTNYDQVIETGAKKNYRILQSITLDDDLDLKTSQDVCVHINGSISRLSKESLHSSFKLTDRSYDSETLVGKPWFDFMERDFASAKAIIVVGFSMQNDLDIRRIISRPQIAKKTVFISGPNPDPVDLNVLQKYSIVVPIGVEGFAGQIKNEKAAYIPSPIKTADYSSFIHEHMAPQEKSAVQYSDLVHFYYLGEAKPAVFQKDWTGEYKYLAFRDAVSTFLRDRMHYKVFFVVANIGNGKTMFCELIRNELREVDIDVFTLRMETVDTENEIEQICNGFKYKHIIVIIDDYQKHLNVLKSFGEFSNLDNITFVLTSRFSKLQTNKRKLVNLLHIDESEVKPLRLNELSKQEIKNLAEAFIKNKMTGALPSDSFEDVSSFIREKCLSSISNVVIKMFDSSYIKNQLFELYSKATKNDSRVLRKLVVAALASEVMNLHLSTDDLAKLLNIDYMILQLSESELVNELFDSNSNQIRVRSSIVARKIIQDIIPISDLLSVLEELLYSANKLYDNDSFYSETMKAIISHSNFIYWINKHECIQDIKSFYDKLRYISFFSNKNPFYWEQFASVCIDAKDFLTAQQCLKTAFEEARKIQGFVPFQVETVYARYLLTFLQDQLSMGVVTGEITINTLLDATERLFKHYSHPEDDHYHVFQLYDGIVNVYCNNMSSISKRDISIFLQKMIEIRKLLTEFQRGNESSYYSSTQQWLEHLDKAIDASKYNLKTSG